MTTARGWTSPQIVPTVDTAGARVRVVTGVTTNFEGRPVAALGIGESDTAVLNPEVAAAIVAAIAKAQDDAATAEKTWSKRQRP